MAKPSMITKCLDLFGTTFNKPAGWCGSMLPIWEITLKDVKDNELWDATMVVCGSYHQYPHQVSIGDITEQIKKQIRAKGGQGLVNNTYAYCDDCEHRQGIVDTVVHYIWIEGERTGQSVVSQRVCRCVCQGSKLHYASYMDYTERQDKLNADKRIHVTYWNVTSATHKHLTIDETNPTYAERAEQMRTERLADPKRQHNPYLQAVEKIRKAIESGQRYTLPMPAPPPDYDETYTEEISSEDW